MDGIRVRHYPSCARILVADDEGEMGIEWIEVD